MSSSKEMTQVPTKVVAIFAGSQVHPSLLNPRKNGSILGTCSNAAPSHALIVLLSNGHIVDLG